MRRPPREGLGRDRTRGARRRRSPATRPDSRSLRSPPIIRKQMLGACQRRGPRAAIRLSPCCPIARPGRYSPDCAMTKGRSLAMICPSPTRLFTLDDAKRVAAVAVSRQLPLLAFQIREPARTSQSLFGALSASGRATGWTLSNRQLMLFVTPVDRSGSAVSYPVDGPPQPSSPVQTPASYHVFASAHFWKLVLCHPLR
jgi:hypothetical protein